MKTENQKGTTMQRRVLNHADGRTEAPSVSFQSAVHGASLRLFDAIGQRNTGLALSRALVRLNAAKGCRYLTDADFFAPFEQEPRP